MTTPSYNANGPATGHRSGIPRSRRCQTSPVSQTATTTLEDLRDVDGVPIIRRPPRRGTWLRQCDPARQKRPDVTGR